MNEMDTNVSSMDIYIKTEPVDPENETTPSTSSLGNQTGTQQQHNVYNSPVLSSITTEQHHVYSSPVLSSITTEQHHVSNSPVLSSMLGSRPNPTPHGVLWTPHGPSHDNSVQGVDRGLSSSLSGQGPTQTDATNKSLSLQKYGKQISFNSAATKLTRLASQYIENESDPKESQLKNSENWNNKSQGTSDKKHRAFPVSMVKTDAVKTIPVGEPNNENPADGVEDAVIHFSIRQGLVDAIVKVFISVSREKSNLININNKGDGFSTISALIADQILSKYLVIPKHVPVSKTAKNEEGRKGGGKELVSQNADTSSVDNDLILNVKVECNSPSDFTQDQTMTDDSQEFCTSAESSSYVNRENHEEKFIKKQQTENHDARSDDFMVKTTEGTETPPEENYSSLQTDTDIDIKMEVETDSECEGDDVNNDDDTEDDNALSNIHTVHNTDGTMKILLPNPKVLENFNRRRGISVDISRENTHGNPEVTERDTSSFSTLKQALIPTGSIKVSSVDNSLPCLHARSPIDPHEELLALQEKAKIGNLTPGEKKKLVEIIEIKQNYNYRKQTIQEEIQLANLNIPNMPTDVPQIKPKLHQFDPSQELLALQEKARVGHLTDEEKKAFIDIIEVQQRYKQMNKKSHSSDQQNPDSKQSEMQIDTLSVEKPMIPFTYEEDTSGLDRNLFYCFRCKLCGKTFKHAGTLKVHERSHGIEAEEFKCPVCGKVCSAQSYLSIHMRTHDKESKEETKYKCSFCDTSFSSKENLVIHERVHKGSKLYKCEECDLGFTRKQQLKDHITIHTGERPFVCEHCDKTFRQKGSLKLHLNTHFGDKPFKCDMCGVGFLRKVHYEKHLRKHKGIRPFECEECGKDFTDKLNLKSHQKVHKDKKDHVCDKCGKGFIQSTHYKNHLKFHEGLTGYTCEICEERFEQRAKLRDHVLDSHRDKEEYASKFRARRKSKNSTNQSLLCHENSNNSDISRDSLDRSEENADNEGGHLTNSAAAEEYSTERPQRSSRKQKINYNETNNDSDSDTEVEEEESLVTIKTEPVDCDTE